AQILHRACCWREGPARMRPAAPSALSAPFSVWGELQEQALLPLHRVLRPNSCYPSCRGLRTAKSRAHLQAWPTQEQPNPEASTLAPHTSSRYSAKRPRTDGQIAPSQRRESSPAPAEQYIDRLAFAKC